MNRIGRNYIDGKGRILTVVSESGNGDGKVLVRYANGSLSMRPFRGLRRQSKNAKRECIVCDKPFMPLNRKADWKCGECRRTGRQKEMGEEADVMRVRIGTEAGA